MPGRFLVFLALAMWLPPLAAEDLWTLPASEWSRPRSGDAVLAMEPVAQAVRAWHAAADGTRLALVHPGGEEGSLWAEELRDWLVALGIPADAVELVPGGQPADRLELRLVALP